MLPDLGAISLEGDPELVDQRTSSRRVHVRLRLTGLFKDLAQGSEPLRDLKREAEVAAVRCEELAQDLEVAVEMARGDR